MDSPEKQTDSEQNHKISALNLIKDQYLYLYY